ncbi:prealbumin-like fold domain-containing protein [Bifidobacterium eulemuris]|uniref:Cna protein B-type domain-containing protein n=1 Tax=Bifidobacterium eulemuris TaxID=1765219 RepID=A0A261GCW2_9BIFI|nr:prealbumin-like fold domain-containing protein [Bifidobacterium eulemuris]OZG69279.1 Cna protein B-type domain-containing protein [Bifidobacterium eulemuris]QOL31216.1 prealbumin-like fold domain-containing protein [Bifidobacterium eulemuris]
MLRKLGQKLIASIMRLTTLTVAFALIGSAAIAIASADETLQTMTNPLTEYADITGAQLTINGTVYQVPTGSTIEINVTNNVDVDISATINFEIPASELEKATKNQDGSVTLDYEIGGLTTLPETNGSQPLAGDLGTYVIKNGVISLTFNKDTVEKNERGPISGGYITLGFNSSHIDADENGNAALVFTDTITQSVSLKKTGLAVDKKLISLTQSDDKATYTAEYQVTVTNSGNQDIEKWQLYDVITGNGWMTATQINSVYESLQNYEIGDRTITPQAVYASSSSSGGSVSVPTGLDQSAHYVRWWANFQQTLHPGEQVTITYQTTVLNNVAQQDNRFTVGTPSSDNWAPNQYDASATDFASAKVNSAPNISFKKENVSHENVSCPEQSTSDGVTSCGVAQWKITMSNTGDGPLPAGWELHDTAESMWYTSDQVKELYELLTNQYADAAKTILIQGTLEVKSVNGTAYSYPANDLPDNVQYSSLKFISSSRLDAGVTLTLSYSGYYDANTTASPSNEGGACLGEYCETSGRVPVILASVTKYGCVGGASNCYGKDTAVSASFGIGSTQVPTIGWRVDVHVQSDERNNDVTIVEELPDGLRNVRFSYSDSGNTDSSSFQELNEGDTVITKAEGGTFIIQVTKQDDQHYKIVVPKESTSLQERGEVILYVSAEVDFSRSDLWDVSRAGQDLANTFTNKVSAAIQGEDIGQDEQSITYTVRKARNITKSTCAQSSVSDGVKKCTYSITVNNLGLDLARNAEFLNLQDDLEISGTGYASANVTNVSVKVCSSSYRGSSGCPSPMTDYPVDYEVKRSSDGKKLTTTMKIPDGKPVVITYDVVFQGEGSITASNKATITNASTSLASDTKTSTVTLTTSSAGGFVDAFTVRKTDKDTDLPLSGAVFSLYQYDSGSGEYVSEPTASATTDNNGEITFNNLECGTAYKLVEKSAPEGYELQSEGTEFYLSPCTDDTGKRPSTAVAFPGGSAIYLTNTRIRGSVAWSKVDSAKQGTALSGSQWSLERRDKDTTDAWTTLYDSIADCVDSAACENGIDQNPEPGGFLLEGLSTDYEYRLTETKSPDKYQLPDASRTYMVFSFTSQGVITVATFGEWNAVSNQCGTKDNPCPLPNTLISVSSLPLTGEFGTARQWLVGGLGLLGLAVLSVLGAQYWRRAKLNQTDIEK